MSDYTTTRLIAQVRTRGMIPNGARTFSDQNLVDLANESLQSYIVPRLMNVNEGYFLKTLDIATVAGTSTYALPTQAIMGKVRDVQRLVQGRYFSLDRIEEERLNWYAPTGDPTGFVLRGNSIVLVPAPVSVETIRVLYYRRPNELILEEDATPITSVTVAEGAYYTTNIAYGGGGYYDVIKNSGLFDWAAFNLPASNLGDGFVSFPIASCENVVAVGDFACAQGMSPIPQIPADLRLLLFERVKYTCLAALGDAGAALAEAACERSWKTLEGMLANRSEGKARVIINTNAPGRRFRRGPYTVL